jgi:small subunit ribosomal protein S16
LTDSKNSTKSGKFLEILGNYDSRRGDKAEFKADRVTYWMGNGAQVSATVHNLLIDKKIITGKKINKLPKKSAPVKESIDVSPQSTVETKAEEVPASEPVAETPEIEALAEVTPEVATEAAPVEEVVA